ncbi:MAG: SH3 domain-containing protein [Rhodospirillales bacterium]|nr:SH3 domain-containing protein [Rhodospirillales bacterium]
MTETKNKPAKKIKKKPLLRLIIAMFVGLFVLELMIELSAGRNLVGGRDGVFISESKFALSSAEVVNTPMRADVRVIQPTDIRELPTLFANRVGKLEFGTEMQAVGMTTVNEEVWYQVQRFGGKIGYVPGNTVIKK